MELSNDTLMEIYMEQIELKNHMFEYQGMWLINQLWLIKSPQRNRYSTIAQSRIPTQVRISRSRLWRYTSSQ